MKVKDLNEIEDRSNGRYKSRSLIDGFEIDRGIAEGPCIICGNTRNYVQVFDDNSYRAFSVCYVCDDVGEF